jgi:glycosyltransferase involved in cell wall biosynthesis
VPSEITFAIPFYSGRAYLAHAIESVLAQRDPDWKAFVCDNASLEAGIADLVRDVGGGRVGYVRNETNLGMVGNFNRCLDLAETDLVTLLHSDDELGPDYASLLRAAADRHPAAVALFCRAAIIDAEGEPRFSVADVVKDWINPASRGELVLAGHAGIRELLRANFIPAPTLCFRKSVLGVRRFPEGSKFVLDWELTTSLVLDGDSLVGIPDRCYRYRRHDQNTTQELTRSQLRYREESAFYDQMRTVAETRGWDDCAHLATHKRILKLNVAYSLLKSVAALQLGEARRGLALLREL